jgi:hypothetical protein
VDWINLTGAKKVHSLIDKVYKRKNLEMAWEKVKANRGSFAGTTVDWGDGATASIFTYTNWHVERRESDGHRPQREAP